jgi:hypothetical protein
MDGIGDHFGFTLERLSTSSAETIYVTIMGIFIAVLVIATVSMKTMIPLRIVCLASSFAFVAYGYIFSNLETILLHSVLIPINVYRLFEMFKLIRQVKVASRGDLSMLWLKPFARARKMTAGETLYRKGDAATDMLFVVTGTLRLEGLGIEIGPGNVAGELGFVATDRARTHTVQCAESGTYLRIDYTNIEQLVIQNPEFGLYLMRLASSRLFENIATLEDKLADRQI